MKPTELLREDDRHFEFPPMVRANEILRAATELRGTLGVKGAYEHHAEDMISQ